MSAVWAAAAGFLCGILSGFGIGGGTLLVLVLTLLAGFDQRTAQGINLLFFLPTAAAALLLHRKNRLLVLRTAVPAALCGCVTAALSAWFAAGLDSRLLRKGFGLFLLVIALRELRAAKKDASK